MRRAARRDENEGEIVAALRVVGALVFPISAKDIPDLLVGWRGCWHVVEVKSEDGELTKGQERFAALARASGLPHHEVRSIEEAFRALGIEFERRSGT